LTNRVQDFHFFRAPNRNSDSAINLSRFFAEVSALRKVHKKSLFLPTCQGSVSVRVESISFWAERMLGQAGITSSVALAVQWPAVPAATRKEEELEAAAGDPGAT
jgi:hypothetical protein